MWILSDFLTPLDSKLNIFGWGSQLGKHFFSLFSRPNISKLDWSAKRVFIVLQLFNFIPLILTQIPELIAPYIFRTGSLLSIQCIWRELFLFHVIARRLPKFTRLIRTYQSISRTADVARRSMQRGRLK